jgi:hypothetical protein
VPIDFGGTVDTTIQAVNYRKLRKHLGLDPGTTRVIDVYQQVAVVEEDVRQVLGSDVLPVLYEPREMQRHASFRLGHTVRSTATSI